MPESPLKLIESDGRYSLMPTEFVQLQAAFEAEGYSGDGYGWHGGTDALVRLKAPELKKKARYDPEASMFVAYGTDKPALDRLAELLRGAMADPADLKEALGNVSKRLRG